MSQPFQIPNTPLWRRLWTAQSGRCALCQGEMMRNRFEAPHARIWARQRATLDHIQPKSKGGSDAEQNYQLAHAVCNRRRGNARLN
ncbi:MAG: HNH endonuclease signature motif containing protein [Pseudomonadota bacterium]